MKKGTEPGKAFQLETFRVHVNLIDKLDLPLNASFGISRISLRFSELTDGIFSQEL